MRKRKAELREVDLDSIYKSRLVTKMINKIMWDGKKGVAQKILYDSFKLIEEKTNQKPLEVFEKAVEQVSPQLELKARKIKGANYRIPIETSEHRKQILALRWIINFSRNRSEKTMVERLAGEIIDASKSHGASIKKKEETHKMAESNRAFAYYRW